MPVPDPHLRAADADRAAVAAQLGEHMAAGRLTVAEYDDRLARVYAARTYGELDALTTDLPPLRVPARRTAAPVPALASERAAWLSWLGTAALVITIWLVTSLAAGELLYPWPVWVVGPWGAVLLARSLGNRRGTGPA